jgi:xylose isomerase
MLEDGKLAAAVRERYAGWSAPLGQDILAGRRSLADLAALVAREGIEPTPRSGGQERLENLAGRYL